MKKLVALAGAAALFAVGVPALAADSGPTDPQIAHIAYTAGALDVEAGKLALTKSHNPAVRDFAQQMVRDHEAVNGQAVALVNDPRFPQAYRKHRVRYSIGEDTGFASVDWGVEWCVTGYDWNWAYNPACNMAGP